MAGKIHKVALFQPWRWVKHLPDWTTIRTFAPHFLTKRKDCRDDSLLTAVIEFFNHSGVHFRPATDFAPELLITGGCLTRREPTDAQWLALEQTLRSQVRFAAGLLAGEVPPELEAACADAATQLAHHPQLAAALSALSRKS